MKDINFFGDGAEFGHVGLAVRVIDPVSTSQKIKEPVQRVFIALIKINGCPVELIEPLDESSPVIGMLNKGISAYHLCFKVPDLDAAVESSSRHGFRRISEPVQTVAFGNRKIVWVFSPVYGLFELLENEA